MFEKPDSSAAIAQEWTKLDSNRTNFLDRAREASALTIPALYPPVGFTEGQRLRTPFQALGARAVNNLSSKLLLSLFPPNSPFFRLMVDQKISDEITAAGLDEVKSEIDYSLAQIEMKISDEIEMNGMRVVFFEALKHLVCAGNVLVHIPENGGLRIFRLDQYCVVRDPMGNMMKIVTKETVNKKALPDDVVRLLPDDVRNQPGDIDLWTKVIRLDDDEFFVYQQVGETTIPDSEEVFKKDELPYIPLRLSVVAGESYGRGIVEEYIGDLRSLEGLTQAIVEGSMAAARLVVLVRPNGSTRKSDVAKAENGAVISGNPEDVSFLQLLKSQDFMVASNTINSIEMRLAQAFLLNSSVQRDAERVTAEEVRFMAQELEEALGGVYSVLAQEWQLPLLQRLMARLQRRGLVPKLPQEGLKPMIITGVEALGRGHQLNRLQIFLGTLAQTLGPNIIAERVNTTEAIKRFASAIGIDTANLIRDEQELAQERQQAMMMDLASKAAGPVSGAVAKGAMDQQTAMMQAPPGAAPGVTNG